MDSDFEYKLLSLSELEEIPDRYQGRRMIIVINAREREGYDIRCIRFNPEYHLPFSEGTKIYLLI